MHMTAKPKAPSREHRYCLKLQVQCTLSSVPSSWPAANVPHANRPRICNSRINSLTVMTLRIQQVLAKARGCMEGSWGVLHFLNLGTPHAPGLGSLSG